MKIVFDIETIPAQSPQAIEYFRGEQREALLDELLKIKVPSNYKDEAKILKFLACEKEKLTAKYEAKAEEAYLRTSFDGGLGQVCAIGWSIDSNDPQAVHVEGLTRDYETKLLEDFFCALTDAYHPMNRPYFIGHNSNSFDIPFLWKRAIVLGVKPPIWFPRDPKPWGDTTYDTLIAWNGPGSYKGGSMERLCHILGIPGKVNMDGSMVWPMVREGRIEEVAEYCKRDVWRTRELYQRMTFST